MVVVGGLFTLQLVLVNIKTTPNESNDMETAKQYLIRKYKHEFVLSPKSEDVSSNVIYTFSAYPIGYGDLTFTIKLVNSTAGPHPLIPPFIKQKSHTDDFSDAIKEWVVKHNYPAPLVVNSTEELHEATDKVYDILTKINEQLDKFNMSPTNYSCSVKFNVIVNGKNALVDFYALNKDVISGLLVEARSSSGENVTQYHY